MTYSELLKSDGGFTVNGPTTGYMVSLRGYTRKVPYSAFENSDVTVYIDSHPDILSDPSVFVGGWLDDGTVYLDLSENISNLGWAMRIGKERNQIAIWDIVNGKELNCGGTGE